MRYSLCAVLLSYSALVYGADTVEIPDCSKTFAAELFPKIREILLPLKPAEHSPSSERTLRDTAGYHFQNTCLEYGKARALLALLTDGTTPVSLTPLQKDTIDQLDKVLNLERCEGRRDVNPDAGAFTEKQRRHRKIQSLLLEIPGDIKDASSDLEKKFCHSQLQWEAIDLADRSLTATKTLLRDIPNYDGKMGYDQGAQFCWLIGKSHATTSLTKSLAHELNKESESYGPSENAEGRLNEAMAALKPFAEEKCRTNIRVGDSDEAFDSASVAGRRVEQAAKNLAFERQKRLADVERARGRETSIMNDYGFSRRLSRDQQSTGQPTHE